MVAIKLCGLGNVCFGSAHGRVERSHCLVKNNKRTRSRAHLYLISHHVSVQAWGRVWSISVPRGTDMQWSAAPWGVKDYWNASPSSPPHTQNLLLRLEWKYRNLESHALGGILSSPIRWSMSYYSYMSSLRPNSTSLSQECKLWLQERPAETLTAESQRRGVGGWAVSKVGLESASWVMLTGMKHSWGITALENRVEPGCASFSASALCLPLLLPFSLGRGDFSLH